MTCFFSQFDVLFLTIDVLFLTIDVLFLTIVQKFRCARRLSSHGKREKRKENKKKKKKNTGKESPPAASPPAPAGGKGINRCPDRCAYRRRTKGTKRLGNIFFWSPKGKKTRAFGAAIKGKAYALCLRLFCF